MKKSLVIHPFLLAIFPILALYAHNMAELSFSETLVPLGVALGFALLLLLLSWLIVRDSKKAAIIVSIFLIIFFADGYIYGELREWGWIRPARYLPVVWAMVFVGGVYLIAKTHRGLHNLTTVLNVVAVTLVAVSSVTIAVYEAGRPSYDVQGGAPAVAVQPTGTPPDIYYIILDAYGRADTLEDLYGFDNSEFIDYLSSRGFYVASQSRANGVSTAHSLSTSLNMEFVNYLSDEIGEDVTDLGPLYELLQNHKVGQLLKSIGYKYIHVGSHWEATRVNEYADINFPGDPMPEFSLLVYRNTMLRRIPAIADKLGSVSDPRLMHWKCALHQFERLAGIPDMKDDIKEPLFVFAHVVVPHCPHVFNQGGSFLTAEEEAKRGNPENYINQLIYTNELVKTLVEQILSKYSTSATYPVIILQGDHGPSSATWSDYHYALGDEDRIRLNMRIFNAYYLPGGGNELLYESITPVNTFRLVFDFYFETNYGLLSDRSYRSNYAHPYQFEDVTDILEE